jgi:hypothetical protein
MAEVNRIAPIPRAYASAARAALPLCAMALVPSLICGQAPQQASEYQVKAAFLLNFTKFVAWPAAAFADANSPLAICILGNDPFGSVLDQLVEGEEVNGKKLVVRRIQQPPAPKVCQELFINSQKDVPAIIAELGPGVLTVGDRDGFLREGGIIAFVIENRHVRFDINQRAASNASLSLSARLLSVARSVQK